MQATKTPGGFAIHYIFSLLLYVFQFCTSDSARRTGSDDTKRSGEDLYVGQKRKRIRMKVNPSSHCIHVNVYAPSEFRLI